MNNDISDVIFATYGDVNFHNSKMLLCNEAYEFGFRKFFVGSPEFLSIDFLKKHEDFFKRSKRGAGYWLWKPYLVRECLNLMREGDVMLYADAGCSINHRGKERFMQWIDLCNQHESLSFQMNHLPEKQWSKMSLVNFMNCQSPEMLNSGQINATVFLLKKTKRVVDLVDEWFRICSLEWTIDDTISDIPNDSNFSDHRHDQSVFSILRKMQNCFVIEDETYPSKNHDWNDESVRNVPVLATRRRF